MAKYEWEETWANSIGDDWPRDKMYIIRIIGWKQNFLKGHYLLYYLSSDQMCKFPNSTFLFKLKWSCWK
jgi:hypothetical protein